MTLLTRNRWSEYWPLLAGFIILLIPFIIRGSSVAYPEMEVLYHLRAVNAIIQGSLIDTLTVLPSTHIVSALHYVLVPFVILLGSTVTSIIVPLLLGVGSLFFCFGIAQEWNLRPELAVILFSITPTFISFFSTLTLQGFHLFVILLSLYIFFVKKWKSASLILFILGSSLSIWTSIAVLFFAMVIRDDRRIAGAIGSVSILGVVYHIFSLITQESISLSVIPRSETFLFDLGGTHGFSFLFLLVGLMGLYWLWNNYTNRILVPFLLSTSFITAFFVPETIVFAIIIAVFLSTLALEKIFFQQWDLPLIKLVFLAMICLSLVSALFGALQLSGREQPSSSLFEALEWLHDQGSSDDVVFTHHSYGFAVQNIANKKIVLDAFPDRMIGVAQASSDSLILLYSYDFIPVKTIVDKYDIRYIIITTEMENGLVWDQEGKGLSFTSDNFETFKKVFSSSDTKIFEVKKSI